MEELYIKININKSDEEANEIRKAGLLFSNIADAIGLSRENIQKIDEDNYVYEIKNIESKFSE